MYLSLFYRQWPSKASNSLETDGTEQKNEGSDRIQIRQSWKLVMKIFVPDNEDDVKNL